MPGKRLLLASRSPRRRALLEKAGFRPVVVPVEVTELGAAEAPDPWRGVRENARRKAARAWETHGGGGTVALAADTVCVLDGAWIGKPASIEEARALLARLAGRTHDVVTAVNLRATGVDEAFDVTSRVTLKPLDVSEITAYHAAVDPLDKAGGYDIDQHGPLPGGVVLALAGSYTNVMGLPMERLLPRLEALLGVSPGRRSGGETS